MSSTIDQALDATQVMSELVSSLEETLSSWIDQHRLRRSILVVEDNDDCRILICEVLQHGLGVPVVGVASGAEAFKEWRSTRHGVVVMDVQLMERESGVHVAHSIGRGPRIVLLSGVANDKLLRDAARALHADWMTKPFNNDALVALVQRNLNSAVPQATST